MPTTGEIQTAKSIPAFPITTPATSSAIVHVPTGDGQIAKEPVIDGEIVDPCKTDPCLSALAKTNAAQTASLVTLTKAVAALEAANALANAANAAANTANAAQLSAVTALLTPVPIPVKKFVECLAGEAVYIVEDVAVPANMAAVALKMFARLAEIEGRFCRIDVNATVTIPDHWYYRSGGDVPQLVYIYRQILSDGIGTKNYTLTIPYPTDAAITNSAKLPDYIKGNWEGIFRLSNNFPVIINAKDRAEVLKVWEFIKPLIKPEYTAKFIKKIAEREGQMVFEERNCTNWAVDYYSKGQKANLPKNNRKQF
jgi:hypothetical protein